MALCTEGVRMNLKSSHGGLNLAQRVNEIYHDLQAAEFNRLHRYRHRAERKFWQAQVVPRLARARARFGVDLCTGTGFVPRILLEALPSARLLCVDLSQNALARAKEALGKDAERVVFHSGDVASIPLPDGAADWVSINAGLHHIPEPEKVLREVDRVLKPGGRFLLGHEPNAAFFQSRGVFRMERLIWHAFWYLSPRRNLTRILRRLRTRRPEDEQHEHLDLINRRLLAEGVIPRPLSIHELRALVDVHADSGRHEDHTQGFCVAELLGRHFGRYCVEKLRFTDYGGEMLRKYAWLRRLYDGLMRVSAPGKGQLFSCILRKPADQG